MSESNPIPPSGSSPSQQPPERRLVKVAPREKPALLRAIRDAANLALDALDYAGDRVAERIGNPKRPK